ncbi:MAG: hypothetical protein JNM89_06100 [Hyphomicrobiaceae bacterium]|nr:hypothetical protein [Hyphomicrobiaceae bacterium]
MSGTSRKLFTAAAASALLASAMSAVVPFDAAAQTARRDGIGDFLTRAAETSPAPAEAKDPREGDQAFEQARQLMAAVDAILRETADNRSQATKLPKSEDFIVPPIWTETREDREAKIRRLLDSALGIVTDVPVVEVQKKVEGLRSNIRATEEAIVRFKEKQLTAPKDGMLPGVLTDTVASLDQSIKDAEARIAANRDEIAKAKSEINEALTRSGVQLGNDQVDLLLDSVLSGDLVRLVAVFNAAKVIDTQLGKLMAASGDNMNAARKYFAMHAALFAMLVHAQDATIAKIDTGYMPKLDAILKDVAAARAKTKDLLRQENRPDQKKALEANLESQRLAEDAAKGYRRYLNQQREQIARARSRAVHDLKIADNTFETVEASFQLRNLMRDSAASFEAIQKLEAPTFEQIFKNEELRREFENLTRKLDTPTS